MEIKLKVIQHRHGTTEELDAYTGKEGEIAINDSNHRIRIFDGSTKGGHELALDSDVPTKLSELTDDVGYWTSSSLTKLSQLTNDSNFWSTSTLTKTSQLTNDKGYITGYCSYCTYCSYCSQCDKCNDCTTVDCSYCNNCDRNPYDCDCNCGDDTGGE